VVTKEIEKVLPLLAHDRMDATLAEAGGTRRLKYF
jgi:hypothetical protein